MVKLILVLFLTSFSLSANEAASDFLSLCNVTMKVGLKPDQVCRDVHQKFFAKKANKNGSNDIEPVSPENFNAPSLPIDKKIQFVIFNDPNYMAGIAYCYFVYRNWITPASISPDQLGMSATGFSILNEDLKSYQAWIKNSKAGKDCKLRVEKESVVSVVNLEDSLKNQVALIGLNPYAALHNEVVTTDSVMEEMKLTINHERIHAYHVACPEFEKFSINEWNKLSGKTKAEYEKKYPSYNWSVPKIAGREYIGFLYEKTPEKVLELVKNCKI